MGERTGAYRLLVGRQLGRSKHRWEDNSKTYLREIGWGDIDWIDLAQDRDRWQLL
jgi:hypothetical protein